MGILRGKCITWQPRAGGASGEFASSRCQRRRRACNGRFADRRTDRTRRRLRPCTIPPPKIRTARRRPKRRSIGLHRRRRRRRRRGLRWRCSLNALVKRGKCFLLPPPCNIASASVAVAISQRTSPPLTSYKLCNSGLNLKKEAHDAAGHKTRYERGCCRGWAHQLLF